MSFTQSFTVETVKRRRGAPLPRSAPLSRHTADVIYETPPPVAWSHLRWLVDRDVARADLDPLTWRSTQPLTIAYDVLPKGSREGDLFAYAVRHGMAIVSMNPELIWHYDHSESHGLLVMSDPYGDHVRMQTALRHFRKASLPCSNRSLPEEMSVRRGMIVCFDRDDMEVRMPDPYYTRKTRILYASPYP